MSTELPIKMTSYYQAAVGPVLLESVETLSITRALICFNERIDERVTG